MLSSIQIEFSNIRLFVLMIKKSYFSEEIENNKQLTLMTRLFVFQRTSLYWLPIFLCFLQIQQTNSQTISINEVSPSNSVVLDEDGDARDWIELYNPTNNPISLKDWSITDKITEPQKWIFPDVTLASKDYTFLFASGKDRNSPLIYQTLFQEGDLCKYIIPNAATSRQWRARDFDDSAWRNGTTGIGYGDGDDNTIVNTRTLSVFIRKKITISDPSKVAEILFDVDYDDAFAAFLNGKEIARANLTSSQANPAFNAQVQIDREAEVYRGGDLERFILTNPAEYLVAGENVLAIQVHNVSSNSSDLSIIPFLSVGATEVIAGVTPPPILGLSIPFLHTNFKVGSKETLYLFDEAGILQDSLYIPSLQTDISIGRFPDGATNSRIFEEATPNTSNVTDGFEGVVAEEVVFSKTAGLYDSSFILELSGAKEGDVIKYTTNGSEPTINAFTYTMPLTISSNKVVKAAIFRPAYLSGSVVTNSYLIGTNHELPVLSVSFASKDFFDEREGIYSYGLDFEENFPHFGANFWEDREKPVHLAFFEKNGQAAFEAHTGVKIFGGWSRGNDQRSLSFFFRSQYGDASLEYPLFSTRDYSSFEAFILRNSGNDWQNTMLRDLTLTGLMENSNLDIQAGRPVVTYLNGTYWGMYNMREKINEHYLASLHNVPSEDITLLERNGDIIFGSNEEYRSMISFINGNNLSVAANYQVITDQIDMVNYIQYQVAQIYFDNTDWPGNNIKFWKHKNGKWRWILFDTDFGYGIWNANNFQNNTINFALQPNEPGWPNPPWSTFLFRKLMDNETFKNQFINTFADELNTRFLPVNVQARITKNSEAIRSEIPKQIGRWGETSFSQWQSQITNMHNFAGRRLSAMREHIQRSFSLRSQKTIQLNIAEPMAGSLQLNTIRVREAAWSGVYFEDVPITLTAIPERGYEFDRWSGAVISTNERIVVNPNRLIELTAHFKVSEEESIPENSVIFNEINYNSSDEQDAGDWVELYNKGNSAQDLSNWIFKDSNKENIFVVPAGTSLAANDYLVLTGTTDKFEQQFPAVTNHIGDFNFKLSSNGEIMRLYNADTILMDSVRYQITDPWPIAANGNGPSLELINPDSDNTLAASWTTYNFNGTPGAVNGVYTTAAFNAALAAAIQLIPNPFINQFAVQIDLAQPSFLQIDLLDNTGKYLQTLQSNKKIKKEMLTISLPTVPSGLYLLRVISEDGQVVKKIIKK